MKTKIASVFAFVALLTVGAYAQDATTNTKEIRKQEKAERKARLKEDINNAGQSIGSAAKEAGKGAKRKAKAASEAVDTTAHKVGSAVNRGLDKAENAIVTEADRLKAKRDSAKSEKARQDTP